MNGYLDQKLGNCFHNYFLQDFANLERNYQNLKKISADLISINKTLPLSEEINKALVVFSQLVNKLQKNMNLDDSDFLMLNKE